MARDGMTEAKFDAIMQRQMLDADKRRRAHVVIDTSQGLHAARADVTALLAALGANPGRMRR